MTMLLLPEKPISVLPTLATNIGLNEAIAIQQLHYWLLKSHDGTEYGEKRDGRVWVYNNYEHWREESFPFWSVSTIRRIFSSLERQKLVITRMENNQKLAGGKRKWYTIDYKAVEELGKQAGVVAGGVFKMDTPSVQNEHTPLSNLNTPSVQNEQAIYNESETTTETTSRETTPPVPPAPLSEPQAAGETTSETVVDDAADENATFRYIQGRCVEVVFSGNDKQFGNAGKIANWALCRSTDPTWQRLHPAHPMDDIEFDAFLLWFGDKRLSWPRRPDAWNQQVHEFRRERDKSRYMAQARRNRQPEQESTPSPDELLMARALAQEVDHVQ